MHAREAQDFLEPYERAEIKAAPEWTVVFEQNPRPTPPLLPPATTTTAAMGSLQWFHRSVLCSIPQTLSCADCRLAGWLDTESFDDDIK